MAELIGKRLGPILKAMALISMLYASPEPDESASTAW